MQEMPLMASSTYASNQLNVGDLMARGGLAGGNAGLGQNDALKYAAILNQFPQPAKPKEPIAMSTRRLVQVFVADPNDNVPLTDCLLYEGKLKLTDLTDQELFFEIDIKGVLDAHNAKRIKVVDKKVKERTEYLEPARIRDLKMTVVTVAQF